MTVRILAATVCLLALCGCDQISAWLEKLETGPAYAVATPTIPAGEVRLYPAPAEAKNPRPAIQVRPGDCAKTTCLQWAHRKWQPLEKAQVTGEAYLSVMMPAGSAYSPDLWRPVGSAARHVLVSPAGFDGVGRGLFDGLRIGIQDAAGPTYFTAYSVETTASLKARGLCLRDVAVDAGDPAKAACAQKVGTDRYVLPLNGDVVLVGDRAWLLQRRPDRSANLVDLFALPRGPVACLPGLIIDTEGKWMGGPDVALSPDLFVSRARSTPEYTAHRDRLLAECAGKLG